MVRKYKQNKTKHKLFKESQRCHFHFGYHLCVCLSSVYIYIVIQEMPLSIVQTTFTPSPFHSKTNPKIFNFSNSTSLLIPKSFFLGFDTKTLKTLLYLTKTSHNTKTNKKLTTSINASLLEAPVLWAGRICIFYALLKTGLVGSQANPFVSDWESGGSGGESADLGFSKWIENIQGKPDKEAADKRKLVSKWHPTTKGTLRRNYRVPSKTEGRRLLKAISSLLSDDDHFTDASSHKGCQIRRETAHGESVCCNNVRALFDELPTPHLIVEITAFPAGPLSEKDYIKAEKLERVLRSGPSV